MQMLRLIDSISETVRMKPRNGFHTPEIYHTVGWYSTRLESTTQGKQVSFIHIPESPYGVNCISRSVALIRWIGCCWECVYLSAHRTVPSLCFTDGCGNRHSTLTGNTIPGVPGEKYRVVWNNAKKYAKKLVGIGRNNEMFIVGPSQIMW